MALTFDWSAKVVESSSSITDLPAFHAECRTAEATSTGMLYPSTHKWKALDLGGGAFFYQADLINGWTLKFPSPGNYTVSGNLKGVITPVVGVYVERQTSAAYITTAIGGSGPTAAQIAAAVRAELATELARIDAATSSRVAGGTVVDADVKKMNGSTVTGNGTPGNKWRGV